MRIALITAGVRGIGSYCLNMSNYLASKGHEVLLISETKWNKPKPPGFYQAKSIVIAKALPLVYDLGDVIKQLRIFKPDLIHFHWPCVLVSLLMGGMRKMNVPILSTLHCAIGSTHYLFDKLWYLHFTHSKRDIRLSDGINSISDFVQDQLFKRLPEYPRNRAYRIYAGIDDSIFKPKHIPPDDTLHLLFVGQIMPEKGIDILIKAAIEVSKTRKISLEIVGTGNLESKLKKLTKGNQAIQWIGFIKNQQNIAFYYAKSDALILPTRWDEAFSLVPIEAMACGTPVIATSKGGTPEIVIPGKTGYLLEKCSVKSIIKVLSEVNKEDLRNMRKNCRDLVENKFTLNKMGHNHIQLYQRIIDKYKTKKNGSYVFTTLP